VKIRADEHVSRRIVETVRAICLTEGWTLDQVNEAGDGGKPDQHWLHRFADAGGQAILTADVDFPTRPHQVAAVYNTGIKIILLPSKWAQARGFLQASHILLWWPRMEAKLKDMKPRECYRPDWTINDATGAFKKIDIDFNKALKKLGKAGT